MTNPSTLVADPDQEAAIEKAAAWFKGGGRDPFVLAGLAGTGKTTTMARIAKELGVPVRYVAPTWKAASNLTQKLEGDVATSIHALIYRYRGVTHAEGCAYDQVAGIDCDSDCREPSFQFQPGEAVRGIVAVDEASMVNQFIRADLEQLGVPIMYVGDHGQLPPVKGTSVFHMQRPDHILKTNHRSGDKIVDLAWAIRHKDPEWQAKSRMLGFPWHDARNRYDMKTGGHTTGGAVFVAYQNTVVDDINRKVRKWLGRKGPELVAGDLVVTRDNDRQTGVFNGQAGVVEAVEPIDASQGVQWVRLRMDTGRQYAGRVLVVPSNMGRTQKEEGLMRVNYGYALTCHRAQGSEYSRVVVNVDGEPGWQWLYTAVTRAKNELVFRRNA